MKNKSNKKIMTGVNNKLSQEADKTVEVLYQKLGDRWFAFSLVDDEIFVGSITQTDIDSSTKVSPHLSLK
jgi:hypothetical protein